MAVFQKADDAAATHDRDAPAQADDFLQIRGNENARQALVEQIMDNPIDVGLGLDVNASRWLVKKEDFGCVVKTFGDGGLLLVAAAELTQRRLGGGGFDCEPTDEMLGSVLFFAA